MADEAEDEVLELTDALPEDEQPEDAFHIEIEGEEQADETPLVKHLRTELADRNRQLSALKQAEAKSEPVGEEPDIEDFDWDKDKWKAAHREWVERGKRAEAQALAEQRRKDEEARTGQRYANAYQQNRAQLPVSDFDQAEQAVQGVLSANQQALLLRYAGNSAKVVYALAKYPAKLEALAATEDPGDFIIAIRDMEGKLTVGTHKPKPPRPEMETVQSGSAPVSASNDAKKLAKLEEEAARTGKRDAVIAFKREMKQRSAAK